MNSTEEIWRPIDCFEGYEVSSEGRVRSCDKIVNCNWGSTRLRKGRILKPGINKLGYQRVNLGKGGKVTTFPVHRLVARAFQEICGEYESGLEVDHLDTNPSNNRAVNLRWCTHKENCGNTLSRKHYSNANKGKLGKEHSCSIPIVQYDLQGNFLAEHEGLADAGRKLNISPGCICNVLKGQRNHTHGFIFKYK